ncbi:hypothetical protein SAMN05216548_110156 [Faunimonas pinastri]|uniref:Uncharacterized protein n=1 Tax=Faunimonas pinastri TaxID=1855383 RepID=A0A1H9L1C3_9HYPH|nr:hypothetical protein [Faunimonas pinastri]SER05196.1 hypothetical protein SAMN05216548_110156 [Faunimonas pinastri]
MTEQISVEVTEAPDAILIEVQVPGLPGAEGEAGEQGGSLLVGTGAPDAAIGRDDLDSYFDYAGGNLYPPKASGFWSDAPASLRGPSGPAGKNGSGVVNGVLSASETLFVGSADAGEDFPFAITDENGTVLLGIDGVGKVNLVRDNEEQFADGTLLSGGFVWGLTDEEGKVALGLKQDGTAFLRLSDDAVADLETDLALFPNPSVIQGVDNPFAVQAITPTLSRFSATIESGWGGNPYPVTMGYRQRSDIASSSTPRDTPLDWEFFGVNGDSTSTGTNGQSGPKVIDTVPPAEIRHVGFSFTPSSSPQLGTGARGAANNVLQSVELTDLVPAIENAVPNSQQGETGLAGGLAWASLWRDRLKMPWKNYIVRTHGAPGKSTLEVGPGQNPFSNFVKEINAAVALTGRYGGAVKADWIALHSTGHDREYCSTATTADAASGSTTLIVAATTNCHLGEIVTGADAIPAGTIVAGYTSTTITLNQALTAALPSGTAIDCAAPIARIPAMFASLQAAYAAQCTAATGQESGPVLACTQMGAPCMNKATPQDGQNDTPEAQQAVLDFVRANPAISRLVYPRYILRMDQEDDADTAQHNSFHYAPQSYLLEYEYVFKARLTEEYTGTRWVAYGEYMTVTRSARTVKVRIWKDAACTVPWGGANFDTTGFFNATGLNGEKLETCEAVPGGHYGFRYMVSGSDICTGVSLSSDLVPGDGYDIAIAADAGGQLDYAYVGPGSLKHSGAWGNCFDDGGTLGGLVPESRFFPGLVLKNPLVIFKKVVS